MSKTATDALKTDDLFARLAAGRANTEDQTAAADWIKRLSAFISDRQYQAIADGYATPEEVPHPVGGGREAMAEQSFFGGLLQLEANARLASENDKEKGDSWRTSHGFVLNAGSTICHPAFEKGQCFTPQYPPAQKTDTWKLARYIANTSPSNIIRIISKLRELRNERDELRAELARTKEGS